MNLKLEEIQTDGGTQMRAALNQETVREYAERMEEGDKFPVVVVYRDAEGNNWLADGFHRYEASKVRGFEDIDAEVKEGTKRDAILHAIQANSRHGLRRTNEDKRRSVLTLLDDGEWSRRSDNQLAKLAGVSQPFVSKLRGELSNNGYKMDTREVTRNGTTYTSIRSVCRPITFLACWRSFGFRDVIGEVAVVTNGVGHSGFHTLHRTRCFLVHLLGNDSLLVMITFRPNPDCRRTAFVSSCNDCEYEHRRLIVGQKGCAWRVRDKLGINRGPNGTKWGFARHKNPSAGTTYTSAGR